MNKMESLPENAVTINPDRTRLHGENGWDGGCVLADPGTTNVSVKKTGPNSFEAIDKREGKVIGVSRMTASADGKSMNVVNDDKLHGTQNVITLVKQ
jgi:hypothetical protein